MPRYAYTAETVDGTTTIGVDSFPTLAEARTALLERDLTVVQIAEKKPWTQLEITRSRIKREELMHISRQLAAFIRAGIPVVEAFDTLSEDAESGAVRRVLETVADDLRRGDTLSEAVERHPESFPEFYRGILRSAELTGRLDEVLEQLSRYLERDLESRKKIKAAMIYPGVVALMSVGTVIVLTTFVLPRFRTFFDSLHAKLPLPTRMMLGFTSFLAHWWWAILTVLALVTVTFLLAIRTSAGRHAWHRLVLRTPVVGVAVRFAITERFCRLLGSMTSAGVMLPEALRVATGSTRNAVFERRLAQARDDMLHGDGLAGPLAATRLFPVPAARMLRVGEETGSLDAQLDVAADFYEKELDYKIKRLTTLFEPLIITLMGGAVGFVAIALVSAMYGIFRQVP